MSSEARIVPVLLLDGERLIKTKCFRDPVYVGDPVNVLGIFNEFEVDEIVLLNISSAYSRTPHPIKLLDQYATECFIPLAYGGGITSDTQVAEILNAGYEKVIFNSLLADDPEMLSLIAAKFGSQAVVASIDVRGPTGNREVVVHGNRDVVSTDPGEWAARAVALGAGEVLLTSVDREGTGEGFDLELVVNVSERVNVPVIAHGGAGRRSELIEPISRGGASAVAAGTIFVFQEPGHGVLVNYPSRTEIRKILETSQPS